MDAQTKHTPGPWGYTKANRRASVIASVAKERGGKPLMIARMVDDREQDPAPIEANAGLIAAAPDLLEAAKEALTHIATSMPTDGVICAHLRAAIAKAEGDS